MASHHHSFLGEGDVVIPTTAAQSDINRSKAVKGIEFDIKGFQVAHHFFIPVAAALGNAAPRGNDRHVGGERGRATWQAQSRRRVSALHLSAAEPEK